MTLRSRLTAAFLVVVLGPVLLGAVFVGATVATVNRQRAIERLDLAASVARTSIGALCGQLRTVAESVALQPPAARSDAAARFVDGGLASAVHLEYAGGIAILTTPGAPPLPWADCAATEQTSPSSRYGAIAARAQLRDPAGAPLGVVHAASTLDAGVLRRLAAATGSAVSLLGPADVLSTESGEMRDAVVAAARDQAPGEVRAAGGERYLRRDGPAPGQPLPLVLSVPRPDLGVLYAVLVIVVLATGCGAVLAAWWLARSTTRPLADLARAADRVAGGDLAARVPVRSQDEVGRLGATFNRMTREMQEYVHALTASRDQLRGHLGTLGDTLSSTHDLNKILQVLLQTAMVATGARAGVVLLTDAATGQLTGHCAEGLDTGELRVPIGSGLLGGVAASCQARRGRLDRDGPPLATGEPRCATYVAVPVSAPVRAGATAGSSADGPWPRGPSVDGPWPRERPASGVLALYDRLGEDEFDDADLVTLRTFAGQAAVAVDNVRMHEEAQRLSVTDPLTGLLNYRSLAESLRREVERASRFGRMLGVLALDLDRFKDVNDSHGHAAGDAVLTEFARRIRAVIREVDLAFRQGGEEFVVLLPETDADGAIVVAERLGVAVRATPFELAGGLTVQVTVSIGIAVFPDHGATGAQVLEAADEALYAAKAAGRDTNRVATSAPTRVGAPGGGVAGGAQPPRQSRGR